MRRMILAVTAVTMACSGPDQTGPVEPDPLQSAVASVTIEPVTTTLEVGNTLRLRVVVRNVYGRELVNRPTLFTSSDDRVVSVDEAGLARAQAEGEAEITATSGGQRGRTSILVVPDGNPECRGCWDYLRTR